MGRHFRLLHPLVLECRHHLQLGNNPSRALRREVVIAIYLIIYWVPGKRMYITSGTDECKSHPPSWGAKHSAPRHFPLFTRRAIEWLHNSQCRRAFRYHWRDYGSGHESYFHGRLRHISTILQQKERARQRYRLFGWRARWNDH